MHELTPAQRASRKEVAKVLFVIGGVLLLTAIGIRIGVPEGDTARVVKGAFAFIGIAAFILP